MLLDVDHCHLAVCMSGLDECGHLLVVKGGDVYSKFDAVHHQQAGGQSEILAHRLDEPVLYQHVGIFPHAVTIEHSYMADGEAVPGRGLGSRRRQQQEDDHDTDDRRQEYRDGFWAGRHG